MILAALGLGASAAARAETSAPAERFVFRVDYANVQLGEATVLLRRRDGRYEFIGEAVARGPLDWLIDWKGEAHTVGLWRDGKLQPLMHKHSGVWNGEKRVTELHYRDASTIELRTDPPPDPEVVTDVPPESIPGTVDPFTATLAMLARVAQTGQCAGTLQVFDGRRRYDVSFEDAGEAVLEQDRPWNYGGIARGCRLTSKRIGGFWRESDYSAPESEIDRVIWLAELTPGNWRPVRMEIETPIGKIIGRMVGNAAMVTE